MSNRNNKQNLLNSRKAAQDHAEAKAKKKTLPDNPVQKISQNVTRPVCKECKIKPRELGSSRCKACSTAYKVQRVNNTK